MRLTPTAGGNPFIGSGERIFRRQRIGIAGFGQGQERIIVGADFDGRGGNENEAAFIDADFQITSRLT